MTIAERITDLRRRIADQKQKQSILTKVQTFQFQPFSRKQKQILTW